MRRSRVFNRMFITLAGEFDLNKRCLGFLEEFVSNGSNDTCNRFLFLR